MANLINHPSFECDHSFLIIIPVYNSEEYLPRLINLLNQELRGSNVNVVFVNDGSTDSSLDIIVSFAGSRKNIFFIDFKTNRGQAAARNAGLNFAKSNYLDYVTFLDADDTFDLGYVNNLIKAVNHRVDVVVGSFVSICDGVRDVLNGRGYLLDDFVESTSNEMLLLLSKDQATVSPCNKLIRVAICPFFPIGVKEEDTLWAFILFDSPNLHVVRCYGPAYIYWIHARSSSRKADLRVFDSFWIMNQIETLLDRNNVPGQHFRLFWISNVIAYRLRGLPIVLRFLWSPIWLSRILISNISFYSKARTIAKVFYGLR
jgi:glycosyltransferase involved in cell wall biosynthesis